jgi:hypothetical protein
MKGTDRFRLGEILLSVIALCPDIKRKLRAFNKKILPVSTGLVIKF